MKFILLSILITFNTSLFSQQLIFEKVFDWSSYDEVMDFISTNDNGFAILGTSGNNTFVLKLDNNGDSLWTYFIGTTMSWDNQIIQSQNSDLIIATQLEGDAMLLRLSNTGEFISSIIFPYGADNNSFITVVELDNGDLVTSESMVQNGGSYPPATALRCFNSEGDLKWSKGLNDKFPYYMILTTNKEILITGISDFFSDQIWFAKFDTTGNTIISIFLDSSYGNQIIESTDGNYYASVNGYCSNGSYNAMKLNTNLDVEWKLYNNGGQDGYSYSICQLKPNRFAIGGANQDGLTIKTINELGDSLSLFIYDPFYVQWAVRLIKDEESLVVAGGVKDVDQDRSIFVFKIIIDSLYTSDNSDIIDIKQTQPEFFPNPATDEIFISCENNIIINEIYIYNLFGRKVLIEKPTNNKLDISQLKSGMYLMELISIEGTWKTKLIKQ